MWYTWDFILNFEINPVERIIKTNVPNDGIQKLHLKTRFKNSFDLGWSPPIRLFKGFDNEFLSGKLKILIINNLNKNKLTYNLI